jgi:hypothetical protein
VKRAEGLKKNREGEVNAKMNQMRREQYLDKFAGDAGV